MHEAWFVVAVYVPLVQAAHERSVVAEPWVATRVPAAQTDHPAHGVAALASSSQVSPEQATCGAVPPAQYVPAAHAAHWVALVEVPAAVWRSPAAHVPWGRHALWFAALVYVPPAQASQTRSVTSVPVVATYELALHVAHEAQDGALAEVLKVPLAQPEQVRSCVAVPPKATN